MKTVPVEQAVGMVLAHDITRIVPGDFKGVAFKKGHVIMPQDVEALKNIGKENIYVFELEPGMLHENDAAIRLATALTGGSGDFILTEPKEGKVNIKAAKRGLLKVDAPILEEINSIGELMAATLHNNTQVEEGTDLAGTRAIPLTISEAKIALAEQLAQNPVLRLLPLRALKAGMIVTGSEVFKGRIQDKFGPVVAEKLAKFGTKIMHKYLANDQVEMIKEQAQSLRAMGAELIVITGGMSVDPDDKTPGAIRALGAEIVSYGAPVLPGAMLMVAYWAGVPVLGLPGCVMFEKTTALDLVLPRIHAGEKLFSRDIAKLGHGGLCKFCDVCTWPHCPFGKH
jgi:molybdopterin biosynthesis enzyme